MNSAQSAGGNEAESAAPDSEARAPDSGNWASNGADWAQDRQTQGTSAKNTRNAENSGAEIPAPLPNPAPHGQQPGGSKPATDDAPATNADLDASNDTGNDSFDATGDGTHGDARLETEVASDSNAASSATPNGPEVGAPTPAHAPRSGCLPHLLLVAVATGLSIRDSFHLPGNQVSFLVFAVVAAYLYPLLRHWMNPRSGYAMGLAQMLMVLGVAECVGLLAWELRTTALSQAGPGALLLAGLPMLAIGLTTLTGYSLGWTFLRLWRLLFLRPARPAARVASKGGDEAANIEAANVETANVEESSIAEPHDQP